MKDPSRESTEVTPMKILLCIAISSISRRTNYWFVGRSAPRPCEFVANRLLVRFKDFLQDRTVAYSLVDT